jgi:hypothetical protein
LRVEQEKSGEINDGVHFFENDLAAQRVEKAEESGGGKREKKRVKNGGRAAVGEIGDRNERVLRVCAVVEGGGEIELGLDADFHALGLPLARGGALARTIADFVLIFEIEPGREGQARLIFAGMQVAAARAILFQASANFAAPFGFDRCCGGGRCGADGYRLWNGAVFDEREITEGTFFDVLKREGATLRAYSNHWSVLRCGGSSGGTFRC